MEKNEVIFEAYFSGTLTEKEIEQFNAKLDSNTAFQDDYNYFLSVKKAAAEIERDNMRSKLNAINLNESTAIPYNDTDPNYNLKSIITWIVGLGIIVALVYLCSDFFNSPQSPAKIYANHFEVYQVQASRGIDIDPIKSLYSEGQYKEFILKVESLNKSAEIKMMLAHAYIESNSFDLAKNALLEITDESSLRDQKYWYLGLLELKQDNASEAISYFNHLQSLSPYKDSEIKDILSEITE